MERKISLLQEFVAVSRYARWLDDEGRRENWGDTVLRYVDFMNRHTEGQFESVLYRQVLPAIEDHAVMPSMRALMTAGPALEREGLAGFNCAYIAINHKRKFAEALYILMCGTGVGFSCERQEIQHLPTVPLNLQPCDDIITVGDSKDGWAKAYRKLVSCLYDGDIPNLDYSNVRPAGARLKIFGGRASGPKVFRRLCEYTVSLFKKAKGRKLNSLEVHDLMCTIGEIVVVGGVRRSALISLSNLSDLRMREAKTGQWYTENPQRALANNSVAYTEMPNVEIFMEEWLSLIRSKSGERGIFNREAAQKQAAKHGRRPADYPYGVNPCLHPDSVIETVHGRVRIADIKEPVKVYTMLEDGTLGVAQASAAWISKRNAKTLVVTVSSGHSVCCTPDHLIFTTNRGWVKAKNLHVGDYVSHLSRARRGASYAGVRLTTDTRGKDGTCMEHILVWEGVHGPVPAGHDIHHLDGDTYNNDIDNLQCMKHEEHARLTALEQPNDHGVQCPVSGDFVSTPWSRKGQKTVVPIPEHLKSNLHQYARVVSVATGPRTDVYDLTVEGTHNMIADFVVVHNCAEILLRDRGLCNLTEVVIRPDDTLESLTHKVSIATILGTLQSTITNFGFVDEEWKKNAEMERLLGVSLTGIYDHPTMSGKKGKDTLIRWLKELHEVAWKVNQEWSEILGIAPSAAITCVKPSGTVSQLVDSASGIHPRHSAYYLRTVRLDKKDPMCAFMSAAGVYSEDALGREDTTAVFYFPVKSPEGAVLRDDINALEHLALWSIYHEYWCDHNPSITITVRDKEWFSVGAWVYENFDKICGISFLPHSDHVYQQAPYIEVTKEQYDDWVAQHPVPEVDWALLSGYEKEDNTVSSQTLACQGGVCDLI